MDKIQIVDMYFAAALLAYEAKLIEIDRENEKRQKFIFGDNVSKIYVLEDDVVTKMENLAIKDVETFFIAKTLMLPPSYPDAIRRIKSAIHTIQ